jgi:hypothetical protein
LHSPRAELRALGLLPSFDSWLSAGRCSSEMFSLVDFNRCLASREEREGRLRIAARLRVEEQGVGSLKR